MGFLCVVSTLVYAGCNNWLKHEIVSDCINPFTLSVAYQMTSCQKPAAILNGDFLTEHEEFSIGKFGFVAHAVVHV